MTSPKNSRKASSNEELQSLVDQDQYKAQHISNKTFPLYSSKVKTNDLYDSLISTNYYEMFFSEFAANEDNRQQLSQIEVLDLFTLNRRKRGRPRKAEAVSQQEQYNVQQDQQECDFPIKGNKNKKKKVKGIAQGNTKNMLTFLQRLILDYLSRYIDMKDLPEGKKKNSNRFQFYSLLKNITHQPIISKLFKERYLNREIVASRLQYCHKILYLKKVKVLENAFQRQHTHLTN